MTESLPIKAGDGPVAQVLEPDRKLWWCSCGKSAKQPFCDGSHKGTGMAPVLMERQSDQPVWLCLCKRTKTPPFCDGSHKES